MTLISNSTQQAKVWINGQYKEAIKNADGNWYVEIDGKMTKVDPNDLFGMNTRVTECPQHLVDYYTEQLEASEEKRKNLKTEGNSLKAYLRAAQQGYERFMANIGAKKLSDIISISQRTEAKEKLTTISDLKRAYNRNGMDFMSECSRGFDLALSKGSWQNQLNLAQQVENSLFG